MTNKEKKNQGLHDAYDYQQKNTQNGIKQLDEYKNLVNQKTSALSSVGQANQQALKYADNTALAQGYATQGAAMQNMANLQNAYQNQVGGINQQYQQQLGQLKNTASTEALTSYTNRLANVVSDTSLTQEQQQEAINSLQDAYYGQLGSKDLTEAQLSTSEAIRSLSGTTGTTTDSNNNVVSTNNTNQNNVSYKVDFSNGTKHNKDIGVVINGQTYQVELGKRVQNIAGLGLTKIEANQLGNDKKEGDIWEYTNNGKTFLLIKDANGEVRALESSVKGGGENTFNKLVKALGIEEKYKIRNEFGGYGILGTGQMVKR